MLQSAAIGRGTPVRDILGISVNDLPRNAALSALHGAVSARAYTPVAFLNAHSANIAVSDATFRGALSRFLVLPDGVGVDLATRLLHGAKFQANLNGTDFVPALLRSAEGPLKVGLVGARPHVAEKVVDGFAKIDARHEYRMIHHGFFDKTAESAILDRLAEWRPDILLVALGVPRQEMWIDANISGDHCTVPIAVGALFDFVTGTVPRAPEAVRGARSEWLFRLWQEPGRLWRRYLLGSPLFLLRVLARKAGGHHA